MRDSIIYSSLRSFFAAIFGVLGFAFALLFVILGAGLLSEKSNGDVNLNSLYTPKICANADGVREVMSKDTPIILKVNVEGVIGTEALNTETITRQLIESREGNLKGDRVKAVLVRINTPGGTVVDSDGIYRALKTYKERYKVPVYAYVDGLCASGGMYVASAADKVFASEVSIVGSVGVITPPFFNFSTLLDKMGVKTLTICSGECKDDMSSVRPWRENEEEMLKSVIDYYYSHFVNLVSSSRPRISKNDLIKEYGARVFPAAIAQEHGFIDESDYSEEKALHDLLKQVGIEDNSYQVVTMESKNWLSKFFSTDETSLFQGKIKHEFDLTPELDARLRNQFLYLYRP